jgi:hypothetical protein
MKNISEYDQRQLRLMYNHLTKFEKNEIDLNSLIGALEFLLTSMEVVEDVWEDRFLNEITTLESLNSIWILDEENEDISKIKKDQTNEEIKNAVSNLKSLIENEL